MEVDSGAVFSLIGMQTFEQHFGSRQVLRSTDVKLRAWGGKAELKAAGTLKVPVRVKGKAPMELDLLVMEQNGPSLLGRNWFKPLGIKLSLPVLECKEARQLSKIEYPSVFQMLVVPEDFREFAEVFRPGLGKYTGEKIHLDLKKGSVPRHLPPRPVPFSVMPKVDVALDKLVAIGVLEPVLFAD